MTKLLCYSRLRLLIGFGVGNLIVFFIIIAIFMMANAQAHVAPSVVYGNWKTLEGPAFRGGLSGNVSHGLRHHVGNWTCIPYDWSVTGIFKPSGDYTNLTFVSSTLNLIVNNSEPTVIALGTYSFRLYGYVINGTEFFSDYQINPLGIIGNTTFLEISLSEDYALLSEPQNTIQHLSYPNVRVEGVDPKSTWYLGYASYPCVIWETKEGVQLNWTYTELWKYTPIDHYDNNVALKGEYLLNELPFVSLAVVLCDLILFCVLLVSSVLPRPESTKEPEKPEKCGQCESYDPRTSSCSLTHEGRSPEQPACSRGTKA